MAMYNWLKISHWRHTGRLRSHEFTSYPPLFFMLFIVGFALTVCSVAASTPYNGPEAGSVAISGTMPAPAPKEAAEITSITNNQRFANTPITVAGTCPKSTLVEIYKNNIFAGSGLCNSNGRFSIDIDMLIGQNSLVARDYDALNQPGPDSTAITAFYDALPSQAASLVPLNLGGAQLLLNTDAVYRGMFPNQAFQVPVDILGGSAPYAVNVQWGDSSNKIVPRANNESFDVEHTYSKPGTYQITLQATDGQGRVAFLTVAAIVNGQPLATASTSGSGGSNSPTSKLLVLWPLYTTSFAMVLTFWLGERREKRVLASHGFSLHPQI